MELQMKQSVMIAVCAAFALAGQAAVVIRWEGTNANSVTAAAWPFDSGTKTLSPGGAYTGGLAYSLTTPMWQAGTPANYASGQNIYGGVYVMWTNNTAGSVTGTTARLQYIDGTAPQEEIRMSAGGHTSLLRTGNTVVLFGLNTPGSYGFDASSELTARMRSHLTGGTVESRWVVVADGNTYVSQAALGSFSGVTTNTLSNPDEINWAVWTPGAAMSFAGLTYNVRGSSLFGITHAGYAENAFMASGESIRTTHLQAFEAKNLFSWEDATDQSLGVNHPATDALGRSLPTYEEVGDIRPGKKVAMFYWTWHSGHSRNSKAYDLSKIITDPAMINDYFHPNWDPYKDGGAFHFSEPLFDYYDGKDKWVIRKQLEMLGEAGVDVLFYDATNGSETWKDGYEAVGQVMEEIRTDGVAVPQFAFMLNFWPQRSTAAALVQLYDDLYSIDKYRDSWFMWNEKPVVMAYPEVCDTSYPGDTSGMKFSAGSAFAGIRVRCPSWGNAIGDLTLSLYAWDNNSYASSVAQPPLASQTFVNFNDNAWLTLEFSLRTAGDYVWELSDARSEVGVWKYPEETAEITSYFNREAVSGDYQTQIKIGGSYSNLTAGASPAAVRIEAGIDPVKQTLVKNFFTFRPGMSSYVAGPQRNDQWGWLELAPQHGYVDKGGGRYELMTVGVAQNWSEKTDAISAMNGPRIRGRSFTTVDRFKKLTADSYLYGYNFQEQWNRALQVDPDMVFITGWNEWVAGRAQVWQGVTNAFPDQFNVEYSRDIEPMKGGYGDNYYYQLIANIRRFKGMEPPLAVSGSKAIAIDGTFSDWADVTPYFRASRGNVQKRDGYGYKDPATGLPIHYTNNTARNDIIGAKMARDGFNIYFYVETAIPLTSHTDPNWMQLLIDTDRNKATGWEGYDLMVNRYGTNGKAMLSTSSGSWNWTDLAEVNYRVAGTGMEIAIPRVLLNLPPGQPLDLEFKWLDSPTSSGDIMAVYTDGEAAPSGRFNFHYRESSASPAPYPAWAKEKGLSTTNALFGADPDEDGLDNLLEYALGGSPTHADALAVRPVGRFSTDFGVYTYNRRRNASAFGLTYSIAYKTNLLDPVWIDAGTAWETGTDIIDDDFESAVNRIPVTGLEKGFFRLKIRATGE